MTDLFANYAPLATAHDEMFTGPGVPREAFRRVADLLAAESASDFERRQALLWMISR